MSRKGLYIQLFNIHGLLRGKNLELGKDADTGGQTKYVLEFAKNLSLSDKVEKVEIMSRWINDKRYSSDYSIPIEKINDKLSIVRIRCGGGKYLRKELLWHHLEEYVDKTIRYLKSNNRLPDLIHSHYADAGFVCTKLTRFFGIPFVSTGHSLGRQKKESLLNNNMKIEEIEKKYKISKRIEAEENTIFYADKIITSTKHEIDNQYSVYQNFDKEKFKIIPPGCELDRFHPYNFKREWTEDEQLVRDKIRNELWRFFTSMYKPVILSLCRPDRKKNITGLIKAYGTDKELQEKANLAVFAGIRKDIQKMDETEKEVLTEILLLMDKYNLYGKMAIPKTHDFQEEVPELYRIAAETQGVFVNSAFSENFGLTLIEAAASGLPVVATDEGGPKDILSNLEHGILIDVHDPDNISKAINKIFDDADLWKKFSNNAIARVKKYYSWEAHTHKYLEMIEDLLKEREKSPRIFSLTRKRFFELEKLIILDIDDTITGDEKSYQELNEILKNMGTNIGFGVATGRTVDSALDKLKEIGFRSPDIVISSVGSEIYYNDNGKYVYSTSWETHIKNSWKPERIRKLLDKYDFLELQGEEGQRKFKVSYNLQGDSENINIVIENLKRDRIKTNLIMSHGIYVDLLPFRASKGRAIRYLGYRWNIPFENILVGGDSGNDEDMLTGDLLGVVVGNHSSELKNLKGRRRIYFSKEKHAAGVIDGLKHYNFLK